MDDPLPDADYWRTFGYLPPSEWIGDNIAETAESIPVVLKRFEPGTA